MNIRKYVKINPILSTFDQDHRSVVSLADYVPDPDHESQFIPLWEYKEFIYWKLADLKDSVSIVGIVWDDDLISQMFYALVLPPE